MASWVGLIRVLALTGLSVNADTITVGPITHVSDGSGGQLWTYPIIFDNSAISATQPTSFDLNDFGPLRQRVLWLQVGASVQG
jgi:hypothetical protein